MFLHEPIEMGLFWVMEKGMILQCELFHETNMWASLYEQKRKIRPCKTKKKKRFVPEFQRIYYL